MMNRFFRRIWRPNKTEKDVARQDTNISTSTTTDATLVESNGARPVPSGSSPSNAIPQPASNAHPATSGAPVSRNVSGPPPDPDAMPALDPAHKQAKWALLAMAFFMADVRDGLGPFLGVYLQQNHWRPGLRGTVSTVAGIAGVVATAPMGAFIDATRYKRSLVVLCSILISASQILILFTVRPPVVFASQIISAISGVALMPALVGMTLGVSGGCDRRFGQLNGRNQAASHAGNMTGAGLGGLLGSRYGLQAVFWLMIGFAFLTCVCVLCVPEKAIDHAAARGLKPEQVQEEQRGANGDVSHAQDNTQNEAAREQHATDLEDRRRRIRTPAAFKLLWHSKPLLVVAPSVLVFHLGNAAMLPFYGQALVAAGQGEPAGTTGQTVVVAQGTMIIMSLGTAYLTTHHIMGYWMAMLVAFGSLPIRAAVAGSCLKSWGVWPVQILDGVGAGVQSVAVPGLVARIMAGTGRMNAGLGIIFAAHGVGSSLSHVFAGWLAQEKGYSFMLYVLGVFPLVSVAIWVAFRGVLKAVIDRDPGMELGETVRQDGPRTEETRDEAKYREQEVVSGAQKLPEYSQEKQGQSSVDSPFMVDKEDDAQKDRSCN